MCHRPQWEAVVAAASGATFLHSRQFLEYHGDRFADLSLMVQIGDRTVGVFPIARDRENPSIAVSHPGATYGSLVHTGELVGTRMIDALTRSLEQLRNAGCSQLVIKPVPSIYHRVPAEDDRYALFRLGAERSRCDLSCTIDLQHRLPPSSRRQRGLRRALRTLSVCDNRALLPAFWEVLTQNLARRHETRPVHSLGEMQMLFDRLGSQIRLTVAQHDDRIVAGVIVFVSSRVHHAQYIAADPDGFSMNALDAVFDHCIRVATGEGIRFFDFGISTEQQGRYLNEGLYAFKSEFGGGGTIAEQYRVVF